MFPVHWVKIQPLSAWGNSFNFSIWYVELRGIHDSSIVSTLGRQYNAHLQCESWRIVLKFLREQPNVFGEFRALQDKTGVALEHPLVSQLYEMVVTEGRFREAEMAVATAHQQNPSLFREFIEECIQYRPRWTRLDRAIGPNGNVSGANMGNLISPSVRGGHQMCFDVKSNAIFMLGGWDGHRDLGDFWRYDVEGGHWECLSEDTRREGGPGPRSCHKAVIHTVTRRLYVLGKYIDTESRTAGSFCADFYYYDLERHTWTCIGQDLQAAGGPAMIYDHQMVVDEQSDMIYIFGGRVIVPSAAPGTVTEAQYSGLYRYSIREDRWTLLRSDLEPLNGTPNIKSRIGHSMVFNPQTRQIYIYAGQRHKDHLSDFYVYDVDSDTVVEMIKDTSRVGGPDAGFTQRSTLDVARQELFLFSGLMKEKSGHSLVVTAENTSSTTSNPSGAPQQPKEVAKNCFWVYNLRHCKWTRIYSNDNNNCDLEEPVPRFAHQLVYSPLSGIHYLFGGNPGENGNPKKRLGDFWQLQLTRSLNEPDVLRRAAFLIRRQQFYELCLARRRTISDGAGGSPAMLDAMRFLQIEVSQAVNHARREETREFGELSGWLLQVPGLEPDMTEEQCATLLRDSRLGLFGQLVALLPRDMRPPTASVSNLV